jgi:hypothetical protein
MITSAFLSNCRRRWHKDGHVILEKIRRAREAAEKIGVM